MSLINVCNNCGDRSAVTPGMNGCPRCGHINQTDPATLVVHSHPELERLLGRIVDLLEADQPNEETLTEAVASAIHNQERAQNCSACDNNATVFAELADSQKKAIRAASSDAESCTCPECCEQRIAQMPGVV